MFGKLGNGLGADCPDLMECLKDVHSYFQDDRVLMEHIYALGRVYKLEVANYRSLVAKLDWDAGPHMFPPEQFDNAWLIHLEYCTSFLTSVQRTGTRTWGDFYIILYADSSEWVRRRSRPSCVRSKRGTLARRQSPTPGRPRQQLSTSHKKAPTGNIAVDDVDDVDDNSDVDDVDDNSDNSDVDDT